MASVTDICVKCMWQPRSTVSDFVLDTNWFWNLASPLLAWLTLHLIIIIIYNNSKLATWTGRLFHCLRSSKFDCSRYFANRSLLASGLLMIYLPFPWRQAFCRDAGSPFRDKICFVGAFPQIRDAIYFLPRPSALTEIQLQRFFWIYRGLSAIEVIFCYRQRNRQICHCIQGNRFPFFCFVLLIADVDWIIAVYDEMYVNTFVGHIKISLSYVGNWKRSSLKCHIESMNWIVLKSSI